MAWSTARALIVAQGKDPDTATPLQGQQMCCRQGCSEWDLVTAAPCIKVLFLPLTVVFWKQSYAALTIWTAAAATTKGLRCCGTAKTSRWCSQCGQSGYPMTSWERRNCSLHLLCQPDGTKAPSLCFAFAFSAHTPSSLSLSKRSASLCLWLEGLMMVI